MTAATPPAADWMQKAAYQIGLSIGCEGYNFKDHAYEFANIIARHAPAPDAEVRELLAQRVIAERQAEA